MNIPPGGINSESAFIVFSQSKGVISEHDDAGEATAGLLEHLRQEMVETDAAIFKRHRNGWRVF